MEILVKTGLWLTLVGGALAAAVATLNVPF